VIRQRGWAAPHALNGRSQTCSSCPGLLTAAAAGRGSRWSNSPLSLRSRRAPRFRALGGMPRGAQRCCGLCNKPLSVTAECRVQSAECTRCTADRANVMSFESCHQSIIDHGMHCTWPSRFNGQKFNWRKRTVGQWPVSSLATVEQLPPRSCLRLRRGRCLQQLHAALPVYADTVSV
jgi:hypothetical protein